MSNLDVALTSLWQLARHWQRGEAARLEMSCEAESLNIQLNAKLGHPDLLHFYHQPSAPPCKRKSPSQLKRQEGRRHLAKSIQNLNAGDIAPSKEGEKPKESFLEHDNPQYSS